MRHDANVAAQGHSLGGRRPHTPMWTNPHVTLAPSAHQTDPLHGSRGRPYRRIGRTVRALGFRIAGGLFSDFLDSLESGTFRVGCDAPARTSRVGAKSW